MISPIRSRIAVCIIHSAACSNAFSQCGDWPSSPHHGVRGVQGTVFASTPWDPDGPGPFPEILVLAGSFRFAGDQASPRVVGWDGSGWINMGISNAEGSAFALCVHEGDLYVGGVFGSADGSVTSNLLRREGSSWRFINPGPAGGIYALASFRGEIVFGGDFSSVGAVPARHIGRWDGFTFRSLGSGANGIVRSLCVYNDQMIAAGEFTSCGGVASRCIASWDGTGWQSVGGGVTDAASRVSSIRTLAVFGGELIAGGDFESVGGVSAPMAARWNGQDWISFPQNPPLSRVSAVGAIGGSLYISELVGTRKWTGGSLQEFASVGPMNSFTEYGGSLYIGGPPSAVGGTRFSGIAKWDGHSWRALGAGIDHTITGLAEHDGRVIAFGAFQSIGGTEARRIAAWDGRAWSPLGGGLGGASLAMDDEFVSAAGSFGDRLVAAGRFSTASGTAVNNIAQWDGARWTPLGNGIGPGIPTAVQEFGGELLVATYISDPPANIADLILFAWNGESWRTVVPRQPGLIAVMRAEENGLFVGGRFNSLDNSFVRNIARWDGDAWHQVGLGVGATVNAITRFRGRLTAGVTTREQVYQFDESTQLWRGLAGESGHGLSGTAYSLHSSHGKLFVGGTFLLADRLIANGLATWDGVAWRVFGRSIQREVLFSSVFGIRGIGDEIMIAGAFDRVDGLLRINWANFRPVIADVDDGSGTGRCDGGVTLDDLLYYIVLYEAGDIRADIAPADSEGDTDGVVDIDDLIEFVERFTDGF